MGCQRNKETRLPMFMLNDTYSGRIANGCALNVRISRTYRGQLLDSTNHAQVSRPQLTSLYKLSQDNRLNQNLLASIFRKLQVDSTVLNFSFFGIGDAKAVSFANILRRTYTVEELYTKENGLTDQGLYFILNAALCTHTVHTLDISQNEVGPRSMSLLGETLSSNNCLRKLILSNVRLNDKPCYPMG